MLQTKNTSYGDDDRSFAIAASTLWNRFPVELHSSNGIFIAPVLSLICLWLHITSLGRPLTDKVSLYNVKRGVSVLRRALYKFNNNINNNSNNVWW